LELQAPVVDFPCSARTPLNYVSRSPELQNPAPVAIHFDLVEGEASGQQDDFQTQPLALDRSQRDKSPELIFERVPCTKGTGNEISLSLPFKKSLRFSKIDLNGQKQTYLTDNRFSNYSLPEKEVPEKEVSEKKEEPEAEQSKVVEVPAVIEESERLGEFVITEEKRVEEAIPEQIIVPVEAKFEETEKVLIVEVENKTKKKRGKKAEPLPSHIFIQQGNYINIFIFTSIKFKTIN